MTNLLLLCQSSRNVLLFKFSDIDECTTDAEICSEVCVNTNGSFYCSCHESGYKIAADGVNCTGMTYRVMYKLMVDILINGPSNRC